MKFKKGDKIAVVAGRDKGKKGKIERTYLKQNKVLVTGIHMYKKHIKKNQEMPKGGVVEVPRPLTISNIIFVCPKCAKSSKLGYKLEKNKKLRICKECKSSV